ncbi:MAG: bacterial Ig-like domain-containing protein [Salinivirgaceae bacterium]|nr:bacterial Ig-like domain-containing protein [Salinivirgaceae bacterium]
MAGSCSASGGGTSATTEEFESGKITYRLNGCTSGEDNVWRQNRGTDAYPVLDKTHAVIYASQPCTTDFSNTEGAVTEHPYVDATGRCTACGQPTAQGTLVDNNNYSSLNLTSDFVDYYAISNSGELYWFANEVNNGNTTINAVLTADIVVNATVLNNDGTLKGTPTYNWTPIGTSSYKYAGTFDGNGHTISGLYFENTTNGNYPNGGKYVGLIGYAYGATIKNVGVIDSYINGYSYVGGICGYFYSYTTITNSYNTGTISGSYEYVGGICGYSYHGTQTNCYNTGTVSGYSSGGICGGGYDCTQTNCYYLSSCGSKNSLGVSATAEEFASGKITYLLNGSTSGDDNVWRQNIDNEAVDAHPVLDKTHAVIYVSQPCTSGFSNTEDAVLPHSTADATGRCTACGQFIAQGTLVTESNCGSLNLTADFVGYYAISNSGELYWFADLVNNGETAANAVLTADIVVNANVLTAEGELYGTPTYSWTPIGTSSKQYAGTFDGNSHTISGLYFNNTTQNYVGLIGNTNGAKIKNVGVIDSYIKGGLYVGGICGIHGTQTNCYNTGTVSGSQYVGGICGGGGTQINCFNTGTVSGGGICGYDGTQTNCYYLESCGSKNSLGVSATAEEFANGKITFLLNGSTGVDGNAWRQNLGVGGDAYPVLDNTRAVVYASQPCTSEFSNTEGVVKEHPSVDALGRCTACGQSTVQGTLVTENNCGSLNLTADFIGYYAISNTAELYWFADLVNNGETTANAVLTADIVVNENVLNEDGTLNGTPTYSWTPIGTSSNNFKGTFDGNGHTIGGLYFNNTTFKDYPNGGNHVGLIGRTNGAKIKNVGVVDSYIKGCWYVGGICGYCDYNINATMTNCYNTGTVCGTRHVGGICGYFYSYTTITNSYNTGTVSGTGEYVGGICGFIYYGTQTNCYNTGTVSSGSHYVGGICGGGSLKMTNCYYLAGCAKDGNNVVQYGVGNETTGQTTADVAGKTISATAKEFASGKIGYLLNQNNNNAWYQNLYSDEYPLLDNTHNPISGYIEEDGDTYTVVGNVYLATDYEIAEGKTLCVPAGTSLTTTGNAVITNNGTLIVNGTLTVSGAVSGNNIEGDGSFFFSRLLNTDLVLNTTSYTYKGTAYTLESGIDYTFGRTILGKEFAFNGSYTPTYSNNTNAGTATVTLTNNADAENVVSQQFTIAAKEVELVWSTAAFTYNGTAQAPSATVASGSLCGSDECNVTVSGAQTNAGTSYTATATALDNANYALPAANTKEFAIGKATPTYTLPENLAIKCGQPLADFTLPSGFTIENTNVELVVGENTVTVTFTPEDADNYEVVTGLEVKLTKSHAVVTDAAVAPTCTATGLTEGSHCSGCNTVFVAQEVIPVIAHTAGEAVAENLKAATCTEAGSVDSVVYCTVCKEEISRKTVVIDSLGHKADSVLFENIKSATCTEAGSYDSVVYCSVCKAEVSRTAITTPANGHKADSVVIENIVVATHTATGSYDSVVYCSVCKAEISRKTIEVAMTDIISVAVSKMPNKLTYKVGEKLDVTGGKLKVTFSDSTSIEVDILDVMVSGFDATVAGKQSLTITYTDGGKTYTATFDIEVEEEESTAVAEEAAAAVSIYAFDNTIVVEAAQALTGEIAVFDLKGRMIAKALAAGSRTEIQMPNAGIYIVKAGAAAERVVIK